VVDDKVVDDKVVDYPRYAISLIQRVCICEKCEKFELFQKVF